MNLLLEPCGPCGTAADVCSSFPWQSEQYMVCVPTADQRGSICAGARERGATAPVCWLVATCTGCADRLAGLNSIAWSVIGVPEGPMIAVTPLNATPKPLYEWQVKQI